MWKFGLKNRVDVQSQKGDTIKNSHVVINGQSNQKDVIIEIYYKLGKVETNIKNIYHDINEIKDDVNNLRDHFKIKKHKHSLVE